MPRDYKRTLRQLGRSIQCGPRPQRYQSTGSVRDGFRVVGLPRGVQEGRDTQLSCRGVGGKSLVRGEDPMVAPTSMHLEEVAEAGPWSAPTSMDLEEVAEDPMVSPTSMHLEQVCPDFYAP